MNIYNKPIHLLKLKIRNKRSALRIFESGSIIITTNQMLIFKYISDCWFRYHCKHWLFIFIRS